jgi:hypothetical protein
MGTILVGPMKWILRLADRNVYPTGLRCWSPFIQFFVCLRKPVAERVRFLDQRIDFSRTPVHTTGRYLGWHDAA